MENIKELQIEIKELVESINNKHKHPHPELISYLKLNEEMGEITQILLSTQIDSRKHKKKEKEEIKEELGDEISDTIIALISLANDFEIDISKHIRTKLDKHKERDKKLC